jgi:UDP-N-acetylglucosamine 4-epimerase
VGDRTTLNQLFNAIKQSLGANGVLVGNEPHYRDFRAGDVRHSQADIEKAKRELEYHPVFNVLDGMDSAMPWYISLLSEDEF